MTIARKHITKGEGETKTLAMQLARQLKPGDVLAINGQLGAGKTAFVRGLVEGLGGNPEQVSSPTFVISQEYVTPKCTVVHIDAYRLAGAEELDTIGWDELIESGGAVIAVEWAERIEAALPSDAVRITIEHVPGETTQRAIMIQRAAAPKTLPCPICKSPTPADAEFAPFCSQRCKRADLGRWLSGKYTISRPVSELDIEAQD
jgi:tRNA threonylcarbamoyladenosine biosynthesis protein TsaE